MFNQRTGVNPNGDSAMFGKWIPLCSAPGFGVQPTLRKNHQQPGVRSKLSHPVGRQWKISRMFRSDLLPCETLIPVSPSSQPQSLPHQEGRRGMRDVGKTPGPQPPSLCESVIGWGPRIVRTEDDFGLWSPRCPDTVNVFHSLSLFCSRLVLVPSSAFLKSVHDLSADLIFATIVNSLGPWLAESQLLGHGIRMPSRQS